MKESDWPSLDLVANELEQGVGPCNTNIGGGGLNPQWCPTSRSVALNLSFSFFPRLEGSHLCVWEKECEATQMVNIRLANLESSK